MGQVFSYSYLFQLRYVNGGNRQFSGHQGGQCPCFVMSYSLCIVDDDDDDDDDDVDDDNANTDIITS